MNLARKLWQRTRNSIPVRGFHFDRPIVLLQSDDWGRVGLRDRDGLEHLRAAGLILGERPYDFYTLETAEDLGALAALLKRHRDSTVHSPCIEMNFVPLNLDFARMKAAEYRALELLPLAEGLPDGWDRPGLREAYREGISAGVLSPALHGSTHFCRTVVERRLCANNDQAELLRKLWQAGTPYIHWRMPWIGFEYWDPEQPEDERFLSDSKQQQLIGQTVGAFAKLFSTLPHSACAPGYRANEDTHRAWAQHGIRVAQNGPGFLMPPHFDSYGILNLYRTVEFEPATNSAFSVRTCIDQAKACFQLGIPAIVSTHSINFHSTVKDFRGPTLDHLDDFFTVLEAQIPELLYLRDEDLWELVNRGSCSRDGEPVQVKVSRRYFIKSRVTRQSVVQGES